MLRTALAFALVAMLFGCLAQPYPAQQPAQSQPAPQQPQAPQPPMNASPAPQQQNASVQQNVTPARQNTTLVTAPPAPQQPSLESTNLSAADLLDQELRGLPNKRGGPYMERTYTWVSLGFGNSTATITIANPTYAVLFNGDPEPEMAAFGFTTYQPANGTTSASGYVIVSDDSAMLDGFAASALPIDINYTTPQDVRIELNGTTVVSKESVLDIDNRTLAVYGFESDEAG